MSWKRCVCCASLLLGNSYTFKNVDKTFNLKAYFSCDSYNLLYIIICPTCGEEYTGETGIGKTKLRDRVRVYRQHIRQPEYQKLKVEEHWERVVKKPLKSFLYFRCGALKLTYVGVTKKISWKNTKQN